MKENTKKQMVISADKFLDLLCCVTPAASTDETRTYICTVKLEIVAKEYAIRAIATNGHILSIAQRDLGFSNGEQNDVEDFATKKQVEDKNWLISKLDAELLIVALKKMGVKRGGDDKEKQKVYYISLEEYSDKNKLRISILGLSHVILEPEIVVAEYPDYKKVIPKKSNSAEFVSFDLTVLSFLNKCWGKEKIFIAFLGLDGAAKVSRNNQIDTEKEKDLIVIMPIRSVAEEKEKIDKRQLSFID